MTRIYLDHAATTPLRPEAREAMLRGFEMWANPSSPHAEGRKARAALEDARERVKAALGWGGELIFTSGASEAAALALVGVVGGKRFVSAVEHDAVLRAAPEAQRIVVMESGDQSGADLVVPLVGNDDAVMAIQHVNSETGARQDISSLAALVHEHGGVIITDCSQSAGKFPLPVEADLLIVSAHKFGGPVGIGALLVRDYAMLKPAGGQERGYRRGTENLPGVLAMAAALDACADPYVATNVLEPLDALADEARAIGGEWLSDRLADPTPYIRAIAMPHLSGSVQVMRFDMAGIAVSQGSACSSGTMKPSHVLKAMGIDDDLASRTIRVSFGWNTTRAEVEQFCEAWLAMAREGAERAA